MQISPLMKAVENHLQKVATPEDVFEVIELYQLYGNWPGLNNCWEVIKNS